MFREMGSRQQKKASALQSNDALNGNSADFQSFVG